MNFKSLLMSAAVASLAFGSAQAQQPYGGCWFPDEVINWSETNDPDAKFNRSRIPLQERINNYYGQGQVETATITNKMCSLTPSQGDNNFLAYQPTYWQYMEKFVNWGGAGNEGIFVCPPAGTIDAAHLNGVKILGTLFFMPRTIGGRDSWIENMLTKDDAGKYPYAIKMYEIAKYLGFDGWFINKELDNGRRVDEWAAFIKCFSETAEAAGDDYMEIQWYDARTNPTLEILNSHRNTSQFLEYNSTGDKSSYASDLGCTAEQVLHRLYSGIECSAAGLYGFNVPSKGSISLFTPEQHTYKVLTDHLWNDPANTVGQGAYDIQAEVFAREHNTWAGGAGFAGISSKMPAMSTITAMPFTSSFSVGLGKHRFVNGLKLNTQDWNATSVQSILPQWREDVDGMTFAYDFDDAYNFGNCIKLNGNLTAGSHIWPLFITNIEVADGGVLRLVYKSNGVAPAVKAGETVLSGPSTHVSNGWTVAEYDLAALNGQTIKEIDVVIDAPAANSSYELKLGQLAVLPAGYSPAAVAVRDVNMSGHFDANSGDIRLTWSYDYNNNFDRFDIYMTNAAGRRLVGQTRGEGFYIPRFNRSGNEASVKVEIVPVMKDGSSAVAATQDLAFPAEAAPEFCVTPEKSYAKVGEVVTLSVTGADNLTSCQWTLPSSLALVSGKLTDTSIKVETLAEGRQNVKVTVTNAAGSSSFNDVAIDVFSANDYREIQNAAIGKEISCGRAVTGDAAYLIDGVVAPNNKDLCWSDISTNPYVTVDLKTPHTVYDFTIYDNHSLTQGGEDNISNYRIFVSDDAENWTEVVDARGVADENIHHAYIVPTVARYVKFQPYADKRFTCRIYELEITARDNSNITVDVPHTIALQPKETKTVTVTYNMNGDTQADNFALNLICESSYISFTEPENDGNGHFTFEVTAANRIGKAEMTAVLQNGDSKRQTFISFILDSADVANTLTGMEAEMRKYRENFVTGAAYDSQKTGNLTDGNTVDEGLTEDMYEDPCLFSNDLWAIFTNPARFSLGKVKVYLPAANKGISDNDKEGYVNNNISIRTSNDGVNWVTVESFDNLKEVSELTCYLPETAPFTYLAIVCDVNPYFYPSMAEVEAYAQLEDDGPRIMPVTLSEESLTHDVIAENTPVTDYSDMAFNGYYTFFTSNVHAQYALASPDSRIVITSNGTSFTLGEYDKKNAFYLEERKVDKELIFAEPLAAEKLYLLCNATWSNDITATIMYEDGTKSDGTNFSVSRADYNQNNADDFAIIGLRTMEDNGEIDNCNYGMNEVVLTPDPDKEIAGISFYASGSVEFWVYAVSALTDPNASTMRLTLDTASLVLEPGESYDLVAQYNLNGEERADNFALKAEVSNNCISLGEISENTADATFTIPVTAGAEVGSSEISLTLINGENQKSKKVLVSVTVPAQFNGWNKDVIVEALPAADHADGYIDGEELTLFSADVQADGAIADGTRMTTTASGTQYILAPFDEQNGLLLDAYDTVELTADKMSKCTGVYILVATNRDATIKVTPTYEDDTDGEAQEANISSYSSEGESALNVKLINASTYSWSYGNDEIVNDPAVINEVYIPLDDTKALKSLSFEQTSSRPDITVIAVAKKEAFSGINSVGSVNPGSEIVAIYNLQGQQVANPTSGVYVIRYSDGTTAKVLLK